jgi:enoyl-[acyl-carrier protein] reductase III
MNDLRVEVRDVFAEVTRYPLEILDPQANLEEDLGIDSVKLGEVFSVLRERFHLPQDLEIPRERLVTIAGVSDALAEFVGANGANGTGGVLRAPVQGARKAASNGNDRGGAIAGVATALQDYLVAPVPLHHAGSKHNGVAVVDHYIEEVVPAAVPRPDFEQHAGTDLLEAIRDVFAEVTRYPKEILDPEAGLEDDLGIDSVKLGEVFSVLRERYHLPADLDIPRDGLRNISGIAAVLGRHLAAPPKALPVADGHGSSSQRVAAPASAVDAVDLVVGVFAEVTRYPREILDPGADLEEDLGIDSVKLGEVFSVLRERYRLPETLDIPRERLRTLRDIAAGLAPYVSAPSPAVVTPMPAFARGNGNGAHADPAAAARRAAPPAVIEFEKSALYSYEGAVSKPFAGKVLFVSGSGRGLGRDVATYLAELGASVVVNSFHSRSKGEQTAEEIRNRGGDAIHLWGSMANPEHVDRVFDEIEAHHGGLDFFVGNASNGMLARLEDITVEHWEKAYRTNVIGLHQSALRAVKLMRRRGGGKIITLSSPAAHGYVDYFGCMGTVKAAVESLTRSMAIEFAPDNIQVNCVSPGPVYGELLNKWPESDRLVRQWETNTAYRRLCEARDVSHFIAYLLSEPVKLFTGSVLVMDGGISSQGW